MYFFSLLRTTGLSGEAGQSVTHDVALLVPDTVNVLSSAISA